MLETFLSIVALLLLAFALLSVNILMGRRFVHTHIDGNKALNKRGIRCVKEMEREERRENPHAVKERSSDNT